MRMRIIILLSIMVCFLPLSVSAFNLEYTSSDELEIKVIERLVMDITHKNRVRVFVFGYNTAKMARHSGHITIVSECRNAEVLIIGIDNKEIINECRDKPVIVSNRKLFNKYKNIIVGAFYWRKGRPHLLLIEDNLKDIKLPGEYKPYIIKNRQNQQGTSLKILIATR